MESTALFTHSNDLFTDRHNAALLVGISQVIDLIPWTQRNTEVSEAIEELFKQFNDLHDEEQVSQRKTFDVRYDIAKIPESKRAYVLVQATDLMKDLRDTSQRLAVLDAFIQIPQEEIPDVIARSKGVLKGTTGCQRCYTLIGASLIPKAQRSTEIIEVFVQLFKKCIQDAPPICKAISEFPEEERADIILKLKDALMNIVWTNRVDMLKTFSLIPKDQRSTEIIEALVQLFKTLEQKGTFKAILKFPEEHRADIILKSNDVPINIDYENRIYVLKTVSLYSEEKRNNPSLIAGIMKTFKESDLNPRDIFKQAKERCDNNTLY